MLSAASVAAVGDDLAVAQLDDALGPRGDIGIVGDDDDRPPLAVQLLQDLQDLLAAAPVERAGGFVRQDDLGAVDQRACDRDTLLLAARSWFGRWPRRSFTPSLARSCSARVRRSRAFIPA